ncbi:MAG: hypothetical protein WKF77_19970 [Planctomycetaceae bacterium]
MFKNILTSVFGKPSRCRRSRHGYGSYYAPAMICIAGGELLEPRRVCAQVGNVDIGETLAVSAVVQTDDVRGIAYANGVVHAVGNEGNVGHRQLWNLSTGLLSDPETFWSQHVAQNGGTGGNAMSSVLGVMKLDDGRIVYLGSSANANLNGSPTFWFNPRSPTSAAQFDTQSGELIAASGDGIVGGRLDLSPAVGTLSAPLRNVPGTEGMVQILGATSDGKYLAGPGILAQTAVGSTTYERFNTSGWQRPADMLEFPATFLGVVKVGNTYYAAAEYVTDSFETRVPVWNIESGQMLYRTDPGDTFADMESVEGQLSPAVNGINGGALYNGTGGLRNDLSDELESTIDTIEVEGWLEETSCSWPSTSATRRESFSSISGHRRSKRR